MTLDDGTRVRFSFKFIGSVGVLAILLIEEQDRLLELQAEVVCYPLIPNMTKLNNVDRQVYYNMIKPAHTIQQQDSIASTISRQL